MPIIGPSLRRGCLRPGTGDSKYVDPCEDPRLRNSKSSFNPSFFRCVQSRGTVQISPSPLTESFETIDEPEAKSESEARSFCEISESERKRRLNLANRTSY